VPEGSRLASRPERVTEQGLDAVERLAAWGEKYGHSVLEIGLAALAAQPGCTSVIAGAMSAEQVRANAAAGAWVPTAEELAQIEQALEPGAR
jgi:aryl-alcohol dehydrogenase-like predicted oxidoreductase